MEKVFNPLVSIIIPVYNGSNYVSEAINSALSQTYSNYEIIVINDGSKDNGKTEKVVKSFGNKIRYYHKENGGVASALNFGIGKAKGDYISWLSHDDVYYETNIEEKINILKNQDNKEQCVLSNIDIIDKNGNYLYTNSFPTAEEEYGIKLVINGYINGCALLIHKSYFEKYGLFDENLPTTQDYDMWYRMFNNNKILLTKKALIGSRCHDEQGSKEHLDEHVKECSKLWIKIFNNALDNEFITKKVYKDKIDFAVQTYDFLHNNRAYPEADNNILKKIYELKAYDFINNNKISDYFKEMKIIDMKEFYELAKERKTKKRIAFGCYGSWIEKGGLNRVVANIASELSDEYEIIIFSADGPEFGYSLKKNVKFIKQQLEYIDNNDLQDAVALALTTLRVDLYINLYNCEKKYLLLCEHLKKMGISVFAWNHEHYFLPYYRKSHYEAAEIRNKVFNHLDCVIWLTQYSRIAAEAHNDNNVRIENAVPIDIIKGYKKTNTNKRIISIARFDDPRKNIEGLLKYFKLLNNLDSEYSLKVVGKVDFNMITKTGLPLNQYIKNLNIPEDKLEFTGVVEDIENIYKEADLNIMTSVYEGFGLTIIEADSYGIPTIGFQGNGYEDMILDGETGYLVSKYDYSDMALKTIELFKEKSKYDSISKKCIEKSLEYNTSCVVTKWKELLNEFFSTSIENFKYYINGFNNTNGNENCNISIQKEYEECWINLYNNCKLVPSNNSYDEKYVKNLEEAIRRYDNSKLMRITKPLRIIKNIIIKKR